MKEQPLGSTQSSIKPATASTILYKGWQPQHAQHAKHVNDNMAFSAAARLSLSPSERPMPPARWQQQVGHSPLLLGAAHAIFLQVNFLSFQFSGVFQTVKNPSHREAMNSLHGSPWSSSHALPRVQVG